MTQQTENDRLASAVRWTLLAGLMASVLLILIGCLLLLLRVQPETPPQSSILTVPGRVGNGDGVAFLELGLIILMLTPAARVLVLAIGWLVSRDWTFGLIACCVLALLTLSVLLGTG